MPKIKLKCKSCDKEAEREEKPAPKNKAEAKQIYFNCPCGASNLRDGTAVISEKKTKRKIKVPLSTADPIRTIGPAIPGPRKPAEPARSKVNDEENNGPLIIQ